MALPANLKYVLILLSAALVSHIPFLMSGAFFSDEAIYAYGGYAILKGVVPYAGIALPQPPLGYLLLASETFVTQSNLQSIRIINFAIFSLGLVLVFRALARISSKPRVAFLASLIYAVFPPLIQYSFSTTLEFTYFVTLIFAGLNFALSETPASLFGAGVFLGLASITWYPGVFALFALVGIVAIDRFQKTKSWKEVLTGATRIVVGSLAVVTIMFAAVVLVWNAYPQFVIQSFGLQSSLRAAFSPAEKLDVLESYWETFAPVLILGVSGVVIVALKPTLPGRRRDLLLAVWFAAISLLLVLVPKVLFPHYLWFLTPVLCYFTAFTIFELESRLRHRSSYLLATTLIGVVLAASFFALFGIGSYPQGAFSNNVYTASEEYVGRYVANISSPNEFIWTSEPGIAFYAHRLIIPPNSSLWRVQGFFNDVFNHSFTDTSEFDHQGAGIVSPVQFEQSWGLNVSILVFIRGDGPVPYPDTLLWEGWSGTSGVRDWVTVHYSRVTLLTFPGDSYGYEVWKRI